MALANQPIDIVISKGARLYRAFTWQDSNGTVMQLAAKKARVQVRESDMSGTVLLTLSTEAGESPDGTIALANTAPNITFLVDGSVTDALAWERGIYDLKIYTTADDADELFEGTMTVEAGATSVQ
jgi:hypothetical protein